MNLGRVEQWQQSPDVELFYNSSQRKLILKKYHFLYSKGVDDLHSSAYHSVEGYGSRYSSASISHDNRVLSFQRVSSELEFLGLESFKRTILPTRREVLGFHWTGNRTSYCNFVLVTTAGIEFYRYIASELKFSSVRFYQFAVGHYWFEPSEAILVAANSPPKLGHMHTFFLNQDKGPKYFNGPRFVIDVSPSVTDKWTTTTPYTHNLAQAAPSDPAPHKVRLAYIYSKTYFVHVDTFNGVAKIYLLQHEKVTQLSLAITVPTGPTEIRVVDNLLIFQNFTLQESHLFDLSSEVYAETPYRILWHGMKQEPPKISLEIKVYIEKPRVVVDSKILYDGKEVKARRRVASNPIVIECPMELNTRYFYTDSDICFDIPSGRCYKLEVFPEVLAQGHPDPLESVLFLLRRSHFKRQACEFLKDALAIGIDLREASSLFFKINGAYKLIAIKTKRQTNKKKVPESPLSSVTPRHAPPPGFLEPELKTPNGMRVLFQSDVHSKVFIPLLQETSDLRYLACIVSEYVRSLISQDIIVHVEIQKLLASLLIKTGDLFRLQQLAQTVVLGDSPVMAELFLSANNLPAALDMFHRLGKHEEIANSLMEREYVYECTRILDSKELPGFDIKELLLLTEEMKDPLTSEYVLNYISENSLV